MPVNSFHSQLPVMLAYLAVQAIGVAVGLWLDRRDMVNFLRILALMLFLIFAMLGVHLVSIRLANPDITQGKFMSAHLWELVVSTLSAVAGMLLWDLADEYDI